MSGYWSHLSRGKKVAWVVGASVVGAAAVQGVTLRLQYKNAKPLEAPSGPQRGFEVFVDRLKILKEEILEKVPEVREVLDKVPQAIDKSKRDVKEVLDKGRKDVKEVLEKVPEKLKDIKDELIDDILENMPDGAKKRLQKIKDAYAQLQTELKGSDELTLRKHDEHITADPSFTTLHGLLHEEEPRIPLDPSHQPARRKVELLVLGDSLVAGVGCKTIQASPILPHTLAHLLSFALQRDVSWRSAGKIGATVRDLKGLVWPALRTQLLQDLSEHSEEGTEYIVVVICGLNDWRTMIERFPSGLGPFRFQQELRGLISEIQTTLQQAHPDNRVRVYLPRLPLSLLGSDPDCSLGIYPVRAFVWYLCYLWDTQKQRIAFDYAEQQLKQQLQQQQKQLQQREQSQRALSVVEEEELQRQLQVRLKQKASERLIEEVLAVVATDDKQKQKDKDRLHSVPFDPQAGGGVYLIEEPSLQSAYALPGPGNVSSDLVHPSDQGYTWWAAHFAQSIAHSYLPPSAAPAAPPLAPPSTYTSTSTSTFATSSSTAQS